MVTKAQKRLEAARRARAALGMEEDDTTRSDSVPPADERDIPERALQRPAGVPKEGGRAARPRRVAVPDASESAGSERLPAPSHDTAIADARKAGLVQVADADGKIDPKHHPKKHAPGSLTRGTSVWYRGERYYVEFAPSTWEHGCYTRISAHRVNPDTRVLSGSDLGEKANFSSFCVHADLLALAPTVGTQYSTQPTMAGVARRERTARGEKDVGDPVAVRLREAKSLDDLYRIGSEDLGIPEAELKAKYAHLNPGQQRMNIGNRMRAKWKKEQRGG